jgi:phage terminase large subunit
MENALFSGKKRILLRWHRRAGKDVACWNLIINEALKRIGTYYYILPTGKQARKIIFDGMAEDGFRFLDFIPKKLVDGAFNSTEMKVWLKNGSLIQLIGSDNYDALAGTNPVGVVFSEYALQDPSGWDLIISPILLKNGGWALFNSTPRGKNHFFDLYQMAKNSDKWWTSTLTVDDTKLITEAQLDQERAEGRSEELIQQEYYVSFERGVEGSYYGRLIDQARKENRVGVPVYTDWSIGVQTAWDIGYGDSTAIIFFQVLKDGRILIIDHEENHGKGLEYYAKVLQKKEYNYIRHLGPFDIEKGELGTGRSIREVAKGLGINFTVIPKMPLEWGIEAARNILPNTWFDDRKTTQLVKSLENYCREYNDRLRCYSNVPKHDWSSHSSDAFRYLASSIKLFDSTGSSLSKQTIADLRDKYKERL